MISCLFFICFSLKCRKALVDPFQHVKDFEDLVRTVVTLCNPEEQERLREMEDWIVKNEVCFFKRSKNEKGTAAAILRCAKEKYCAQGTWVLAEGFNSFLGNVLHSEGWPSEGRVAMLRSVGEDHLNQNVHCHLAHIKKAC